LRGGCRQAAAPQGSAKNGPDPSQQARPTVCQAALSGFSRGAQRGKAPLTEHGTATGLGPQPQGPAAGRRRGGRGGREPWKGCNFRSFPGPVSRRSGSRRPGLEAQPGGGVPRLAAGPGQPIQQLTSRARAGHHHHRGPRPGDPLQLLPGAQGDGFPGGGVVEPACWLTNWPPAMGCASLPRLSLPPARQAAATAHRAPGQPADADPDPAGRARSLRETGGGGELCPLNPGAAAVDHQRRPQLQAHQELGPQRGGELGHGP